MRHTFDLDMIDFEHEIALLEKTSVKRPSEIVAELDKYVIGQVEAKKSLAVTITNHEVITQYNRKRAGNDLRRTNLLMVGPSGSGKTMLVQTLARILKKPILIVDITEFTQSGYVGRDVNDILKDLSAKCGDDLEKIQNAIIVVDEIDKITTVDYDSDVSTLGVQRGLLKLIEGGEKRISSGRNEEGRLVDTSNILWIFCGAFTTYTEKEVAEKKTLGFEKKIEKKERHAMTHEDLIKTGMLREFVGRVGSIVQLEKLTKEDYYDILTKPVNSVYNEYAKLGELRNINLSLTEAELKQIVEDAEELGVGARGLRILAEKHLADRMYI